MTTTIQQAAHKIESALKNIEHDLSDFVTGTVEPAVEREFAAIKPQLLALEKTTLDMVWQAAETYLLSLAGPNPMSVAVAIGSVTSQLPAELKALEHLVAAAFAGAVQSQATAAAAAP